MSHADAELEELTKCLLRGDLAQASRVRQKLRDQGTGARDIAAAILAAISQAAAIARGAYDRGAPQDNLPVDAPACPPLAKGIMSYAQNMEDVLLWRAVGGVAHGVYIDVGAQDPNLDSVSKAFFERGWKGVHVEPSPAYAAQLREARPGDVVIEAAVSTEAGLLRFFEIPHTGISTAIKEVADRHALHGHSVIAREVNVVTLSEVFRHMPATEIHWLKIDVEGMETNVLRSWQLDDPRPWVLVVESTLPMTQVESHMEWEPIVVKLGYRFAHFDGLNRFYVHYRHEELRNRFSWGPNLFDDFVVAPGSSFDSARRFK